MKTISIRVDDIEIGERHRALSADAVKTLAASMKDIGLRQPITVRVVDEMKVDGEMVSAVPVLVAGRHRLEAAMHLGWSHIDCLEVDDDAIKAEMWEIAENLHRVDLSKEQRDEHIRRYAELIEAQAEIPKPQSAAMEFGYGKPPPRAKSTARKIAEATGLSDDTVRRALNPQPKVVHVIEPKSDAEAIIEEANAIVRAWNRARQESRDLAMEQIDLPVFDRTRAA